MRAELTILSYDIPSIRKSVAEIKKAAESNGVTVERSSRYTKVPVDHRPKIWGYDGKPTIKKKVLELYGTRECLRKIVTVGAGKIPEGVYLSLI